MTKQQTKYSVLLGLILITDIFLYQNNILVRNGLVFGLIIHSVGIIELKKEITDELKWIMHMKSICVMSLLFTFVGKIIQPFSYYYVVIIILSIFGQYILIQKK